MGTTFWFGDQYHLLPRWDINKYAVNFGMALQMVLISLSLAELIHEIREQLLTQSKNYSKELEVEVENRAGIIIEQNNKMESILSSIRQGIFILDDSCQTGAYYSDWTKRYLVKTRSRVLMALKCSLKTVNGLRMISLKSKKS